MVGVEVWGGLSAKSLQPMVERLLGITRDTSVKPAQQLSAVRVIIGFERQQFGRAKEELSVRRQTDPNARARPIDSVVSPAMIEYLLHFLTSLIERPDISDRIAIAAGNLIHSLQRLVLAEQRWYRVQSTPKPLRERNSSRSTDVESPSSEPLSEVGRPTGRRSHRHKDNVNRQTVNNFDRHAIGADRSVDDANWATGDEFRVSTLESAGPAFAGSGFA